MKTLNLEFRLFRPYIVSNRTISALRCIDPLTRAPIVLPPLNHGNQTRTLFMQLPKRIRYSEHGK